MDIKYRFMLLPPFSLYGRGIPTSTRRRANVTGCATVCSPMSPPLLKLTENNYSVESSVHWSQPDRRMMPIFQVLHE